MFDSNTFKTKMSEILKQTPDRLQDDVLLTNLVVDSFVLVDMVIELQEEYGILLMQEDLKDVKTVGNLAAVFQDRANRK